MANELENGLYMIVSAMSENLHLDVSGASAKNGANVMVMTQNYTRAQGWKVTNTKTGYEVLSRWLGKAMDVEGGKQTSGTNVQIWTDNNSRAQRWTLTATGKTMKVANVSYPTYYVYSYGSKCVLDAEGATATAGTNVMICKYGGGTNQQWAFVPIPKLYSGGVYEIHTSMAKGKMCLDAADAGTANGTNIQMWARNQTNAQKFYLTDEGDGWSIRNINSGKYVSVDGSKVTTRNANVQLYEDTDGRAQRWKLTEYGVAKIGKTQCAVVKFGAGNKNDYMMDCSWGGSSNGANVKIYDYDDTPPQAWVLLPTTAEDPTMPTPYNIKLANGVGVKGYQNVTPQAVHYPTWECSDAWVTDGANSYRWRWRKRVMKGSTSSWQAWSDWEDWETASCHQSGNQAWETHGLDGLYYTFDDDIKNEQVEIQVCSQGVDDGTENITSSIKDQICHVICKPTIELSGCAWSGDGLRCSYTTNYPYGAITIHVQALFFDGKQANSKIVSVSAREGTFLIPQDIITVNPKDGASMILRYYIGNDQYSKFGGGILAATSTVAYDAGTVDVTPSVVESDGLTLTATVPFANTVRMWVVTDNESVEAEGTVSDGKTTFKVIYPFGKTIHLFTSYINSDGTEWGTDYTEFTPSIDGGVHAFNWDGGYLILWLKTGDYVTEKRSYDVESEKHVLTGRSHPAVSMLCDNNGAMYTSVSSSISGVLLPDDKYGCTVDDVQTLIEQGHVTYRSPSGRYAQVAITGADIEQTSFDAEVSVSMIEEQL